MPLGGSSCSLLCCPVREVPLWRLERAFKMSSLLSGSGLSIFSSPFGRQLAASSLASAASSAASASVSGGGAAISFEQHNWPSAHEWFSFVHFDLVELREKKGVAMYNIVKALYNAFLGALALCAVNFLTCIIMSATAGDSGTYSGSNIAFSILWAAVMGGVGMGATWQIYFGLAAPATFPLLIGKALGATFALLSALMCLCAFGNINGFAAFGTSRFVASRNAGVADSAVDYWMAMTALESLGWLAHVGFTGMALARVFAGVAAEEAAVKEKKGVGATGGSAAAPAEPDIKTFSLRGLFIREQ